MPRAACRSDRRTDGTVEIDQDGKACRAAYWRDLLLGRARAGRRHPRAPNAAPGQALVEFALVFPLFFLLLVGIMEFGFEFNGLLSINFASRDAALIAAEAANDAGADCAILHTVDGDVGAPADKSQIQSVIVYWTDASGNVLTPTGSVGTGGLSNTSNAYTTYTRTGSTTCVFGGVQITVPYSLTSQNKYPPDNRCNQLQGCVDTNGTVHTGLDTVGVQVTYRHQWRTPFPYLIGGNGNGPILQQSNAMRMEPIL